MPGDPGATVVTNACAYYTSRTRLRVQRAPGIPRALHFRAKDSATTRVQRAAGIWRRMCVPRMLRSAFSAFTRVFDALCLAA
jgi:hypothetical protein